MASVQEIDGILQPIPFFSVYRQDAHFMLHWGNPFSLQVVEAGSGGERIQLCCWCGIPWEVQLKAGTVVHGCLCGLRHQVMIQRID